MEHSAASALLDPASGCDSPLRPTPSRASHDAALAGLAGSALSRRFRHWGGAGGRRYLFSVFPIDATCLDDLPRFEDAVVLTVLRDLDGGRAMLTIDETGPLPELFYQGSAFRDAVAAGANEVHVHLLTEDAAARAALVRDLASAG